MARPVGEELARNPTAISRPEGGWFAKIWKQHTGSDPGNSSVDKIHLERANPFTLWIASLKEPAAEPVKDSSPAPIPSRAFTLWTAAETPENPFEENPAGDSPGDQVIAPLPEGVFGETDEATELSGQAHEQDIGSKSSRGQSPGSAPAHPFTIWTTPEALASLPSASADQLYSHVSAPEVEDEEDTPADDEVSRPEPSLIRIENSGAFTLWTNDRYNSPGNAQESSPDAAHDCSPGEQVQDEAVPALVGAEQSSQGGGVERLVALALLILGLVAAMFVISSKNKAISDFMANEREAEKKMSELTHGKHDLNVLLDAEQEKATGLEKKLAGLESGFTTAKENHAKESADLRAQGDQLALNLKEMSSMLEESKRAFAQEQETRVQADLNYRKASSELEAQLVKTESAQKELEIQRKALSELGASMEQQKKTAAAAATDARLKMAAAGKALEDAKAQMAAGKVQLEQSEKKAAQLAAEVKKLKARVDELKANPAESPLPIKPPQSKPDPAPEADPKESPKEKPDKGPINV